MTSRIVRGLFEGIPVTTALLMYELELADIIQIECIASATDRISDYHVSLRARRREVIQALAILRAWRGPPDVRAAGLGTPRPVGQNVVRPRVNVLPAAMGTATSPLTMEGFSAREATHASPARVENVIPERQVELEPVIDVTLESLAESGPDSLHALASTLPLARSVTPAPPAEIVTVDLPVPVQYLDNLHSEDEDEDDELEMVSGTDQPSPGLPTISLSEILSTSSSGSDISTASHNQGDEISIISESSDALQNLPLQDRPTEAMQTFEENMSGSHLLQHGELTTLPESIFEIASQVRSEDGSSVMTASTGVEEEVSHIEPSSPSPRNDIATDCLSENTAKISQNSSAQDSSRETETTQSQCANDEAKLSSTLPQNTILAETPTPPSTPIQSLTIEIASATSASPGIGAKHLWQPTPKVCKTEQVHWLDLTCGPTRTISLSEPASNNLSHESTSLVTSPSTIRQGSPQDLPEEVENPDELTIDASDMTNPNNELSYLDMVPKATHGKNFMVASVLETSGEIEELSSKMIDADNAILVADEPLGQIVKAAEPEESDILEGIAILFDDVDDVPSEKDKDVNTTGLVREEKRNSITNLNASSSTQELGSFDKIAGSSEAQADTTLSFATGRVKEVENLLENPDAPSSSIEATEVSQSRECPACIEATPGNDFVKFPCNHEYCNSCVTNMFSRACTDEASYPVHCCPGQPVDFETVKDILTSKLVIDYQEKGREYSTTNREYCSQPTCGAYLRPGYIAGRTGLCIICFQHTCTLCKKTDHGGLCSDDNGTAHAKELMELNGWQKCIRCGHAVAKVHGCNHITCICDAQWCYVCRAPWDNSHYSCARRTRTTPEVADLEAHRRANLQAAVVPATPCQHAVGWTFSRGEGRCRECEQTLPDFLYSCPACPELRCRRCSGNVRATR